MFRSDADGGGLRAGGSRRRDGGPRRTRTRPQQEVQATRQRQLRGSHEGVGSRLDHAQAGQRRHSRHRADVRQRRVLAHLQVHLQEHRPQVPDRQGVHAADPRRPKCPNYHHTERQRADRGADRRQEDHHHQDLHPRGNQDGRQG